MAYNFVNDDAQISLADGCFHDTKNGYSSDFSENGNVDGWDVYNGIHIYGSWGGYLFGTFHETSGYIGRSSVFIAVPAEYFYTVKIVMKVNPINNIGSTIIPTTGKLKWRTLTNTVWDTDKELEFTVTADNNWHSYILNMGPEYYWQGDVNDLRIFPVINGVADNEFFIRSIKIQSVQTFRCVNYDCSYYNQYSHPCPAVGSNTSVTSEGNEGSVYVISETNNEFILDINGYGQEIFEIPYGNYTGQELTKTLATEFSKISMGGYAEISLTYSDDREFTVKSGMLGNESTVVVHDSSLARYIKFYDSFGTASYTTTLGTFPATGFRPKSSFTPSTFQLLGMFDNKENTSFEFDPGRYAIEGGRSDILANGFGDVSITDGDPDIQRSGAFERGYGILYNYGKTVIDFTHPFNSSGNIKKIFLACTYDTGEVDVNDDPIISRGCKLIVFRPRKDGRLINVTSVDIPERDEIPTRLYSTNQETLEIDCDIWVGRGDLIGVYNLNLYVGKVVFSSSADASYYQSGINDSPLLPTVNVALNKISAQSSQFSGPYPPSKANDGDTNTYNHTLTAAGEWWKVDLGEEYSINRIRLKKRSGYGARPNDYYIQSADDYDFNTNVVNLITANNETSEDIYYYPADFGDVTARYLRVLCHTVGQYINIAEFEVYTAINDGDPGAGAAFDPGKLLGNGNAGLLVYARSDYTQQALEMDIDLQRRVNIASVILDGESKTEELEFNIARCLDVNWQVDLFGGQYSTGYYDSWNSVWRGYDHDSVAYGLDNLADGIYSPSAGLTADSYSDNGSSPVTSQGNHYFYVNGDEEWLGIIHHVPSQYLSSPWVDGFTSDPIAIYLTFPLNKKKYIYKSAIYFKERWNFRNLALSYYLGFDSIEGNSDHYSYQLIDEYDAITMDGVRYSEGTQGYENVDDYIFQNPAYGKSVRVQTGVDADGFGSGYIDNYEAFLEMQYTDWSIIKHEFGPILAGGFRIYTNLHYSTKINEIELFCIVDDSEASLSSGFELMHSHYGDLWWPEEVSDVNNTQATAQINDTPRYVNIVVEPITTTEIYNITFSVNSGDLYVGEKGCQYEVFPVESKTDTDNEASVIYLKNIYDKNFNLFVDIARESKKEDGLILYSKMNDASSIDNPEVGPGGYYVKNDDYLLRNEANNCVINCPVYGLKNLLDGKKAYYSKDGGYIWDDYGTLTPNVSVNLENSADTLMTYMKVPILYSSRYWKLAWFMLDRPEMKVREARFFYQGNEIENGVYYHEQTLGRLSGPLSGTAPHLNNGSVRGSYYSIVNNEYIAVDFGSSSTIIDGILLFHDALDDTCSPVNTTGEMDLCSRLYLRGRAVYDSSYYNNNITTTGPGVTIDATPAYSFNGTDYIILPYNDNFDIDAGYTIDLFVKFNTLPAVGEEVVFISNWPGTGTNAWKFMLYNDAGDLKLQLYTNSNLILNYTWSSGTTVPAITTGVEYWISAEDYNPVLVIDGVTVHSYSGGSGNQNPNAGNNDVVVGKNLNGTMRSIRLSNGRIRGTWTTELRPCTSDLTSTDGTTQADSIASGAYLSDYAFDNIVATYWSSDGSGFPHWIGYKFDNMEVINRVDVNNTTYYVTEFDVEGSTDNSNDADWSLKSWTTIATVSGVAQGKGYYEFDNNIPYMYYRLYSTAGVYSYWQIFEIELKSRIYEYDPYLTMSLYSSDDDYTYAKYCDLDLPGQSDGYYYTENKFQEEFNTYLATDLGKRYDLEIIRSYGAADAPDISNTTYSYSDTADVESAFENGTTTSGDARWVFVPIVNGDGVSRSIRKLGVYPRIQTITAPGGGYNTEWVNLGNALTTYTGETNVAYGANVTASSEFYSLSAAFITNGNTTGTFSDAWGSDTTATQWLKIDLGSVKSVYKFILHHGINTSSTDYMINNYTIQTSEDDTTYVTRFTTTANTSFERTHQLVDSVSARYVKINITSYTSTDTYRPISATQYGWFYGAILREVEVYEDYGYDKISSEDYPIICTNMNYQFYINGITLVGVDPNDTSIDWSSSEYSFSDSVRGEPEKVGFEPWDGPYDFEKWIAIKQNTATGFLDGPDYLKHIQATSTQELNPCDYSQWWNSNLSTLSEEYMYVKKFSTVSLKIEYPASSGIEDIYFYEGDNFGIDELVSWRDGFSFWWYIDDINNFDIDYGYFKFGGYDATRDSNKVEYRWNFSTISGSLSSGWNDLFLRFKSADSIVYTEPVELQDKDVRIPNTITLKTIGYVFRGKGYEITMYWNGFGIVRNIFQDLSVFDNGLYLTQNDFLTCPLNELDLSHGTIEFNIRTDYDYRSKGLFSEFLLRSLFHISNTTNDTFGALFSENGLQVYYGNVDGELYYFGISEISFIDVDSMFNIAFVFSNTGEHIDNDGSTIRVYVDNTLVGKTTETWGISDNKYFKFLLGGKSLLALKEDSFTAETHSVDGVVGNLKIYNYCKTDFSDVINDEEVGEAKLKKPSELIEISKDNLTFYKVGSGNLPLSFNLVAPDTTIPIYVRPVIPGNLTGAERRTASIIAEWDITV